MADGSSQYKIKASGETAVFLRRLHPRIKGKIKSALKLIFADPASGKSLKEELEGLRSFRTGRFKIIYRIARAHTIEIIAIGPRKNIYEETYRIIKNENS